MGFFQFVNYAAYVYAFILGGFWVGKQYWNDTFDRPYTAGDSISVFFGVLFGFFALTGAGPSFGAIIEGKAAGTLAFRVIDRRVKISNDSQTAKDHKLSGQIKFDSVEFFYPTRPE